MLHDTTRKIEEDVRFYIDFILNHLKKKREEQEEEKVAF